MAKKPNTGGASDRKRRGMHTIVVPLTPEQHARIKLAAGTFTGPERAVTRFAAAALDAAARKILGEDEKQSRK